MGSSLSLPSMPTALVMQAVANSPTTQHVYASHLPPPDVMVIGVKCGIVK